MSLILVDGSSDDAVVGWSRYASYESRKRGRKGVLARMIKRLC